MPWVYIDNIGEAGIYPDVPGQNLEQNFWTECKNVRFIDGRAEKFLGHEEIFAGLAGNIDPYWAQNFDQETDSHWIFADLTKLYGITSGVRTEIGSGFSPNIHRMWNGAELGGIVVITNGVDKPRSWIPGNNTEELVNWPTDLRCDVIVPFNYFLVALNLRDGGASRPQRIRWSHPAVPGALPNSWDIADPTTLAGEFDLSDTGKGEIVGAKELRGFLLIYKQRSTWLMRYIGGVSVFAIDPTLGDIGAINHNCISPFSYKGGEYHCVFTGDDVIIHDGRGIHETLSSRMRQFIQRKLDPDNFNRSFIVHNARQRENWICFPERGNIYPSFALVWNYDTNAIGCRELPNNTAFITPGIVGEAEEVTTWNNLQGTWNDLDFAWRQRGEQRYTTRLLECQVNPGKFLFADATDTFNGVAMESHLIRKDLIVGGVEREGKPRDNAIKRKILTGVRTAMTEGRVKVKVNYSNKIGSDSDVNETDAVVSALDPTEHYVIANGKSLTLTVSNYDANHWAMESYALDVEELGEF